MKVLMLDTKERLQRMTTLFVNKLSCAQQQRAIQVNLLFNTMLQKATYRRFELFQYTACLSLALDRCKLVSTSVKRLRENVARAIIPPVLVQPWFPSSFCPRRRVVHNIPAVRKRLFKFPVTLTTG